MNKENLKKIFDKYQSAESDILELDKRFGISVFNSKNENFYNKYNYIIFKLFEYIFGNDGRELIENYIFDELDMPFEELYKNLKIYE